MSQQRQPRSHVKKPCNQLAEALVWRTIADELEAMRNDGRIKQHARNFGLDEKVLALFERDLAELAEELDQYSGQLIQSCCNHGEWSSELQSMFTGPCHLGPLDA